MLGRIALLLVWLQALPASALVVDGANSERAEAPPRDGSAWAHVGRLGSNTAIYLGEGWILSASHSGVTDVTFDGVSYPPVPGSKIRLDAPDGSKRKSDLALFRVEPAPELPRLPLRRRPVAPGTLVTLVGFGAGPGEPVVWRGEHGFRGAAGRRRRRCGRRTCRRPPA